jgi:molybdopterin-containing oxidoreductase family iron-sulfur binding subunit
MERAAMRVHLGTHENETSERCHWHVPQAHSLESWSDARAADGTVTIVQPLIAPLFGGKTAHEVLAALSSRPERASYEIVRDFWKSKLGAGPDFDKQWNRALHDGVVAGTQFPEKSVSARRRLYRGRACDRFDRGIRAGVPA